MGVLLTVATIAISAGAGVAAELRWRERAARASRALLVGSLYTVVPFVVFFNLARADVGTDAGLGIVLVYVALGLTAGWGCSSPARCGSRGRRPEPSSTPPSSPTTATSAIPSARRCSASTASARR